MRSDKLEKKEKSKLSVLTAWFWFALYMLPVVLFVFSVLDYQKSNSQLMGLGDYDNFIVDYMSLLPFDFFKNIFDDFFNVIGGFVNDDFCTFYDLITSIVSYYGFVKLVHIIIDLIFIVPDLFTDWLERKF